MISLCATCEHRPAMHDSVGEYCMYKTCECVGFIEGALVVQPVSKTRRTTVVLDESGATDMDSLVSRTGQSQTRLVNRGVGALKFFMDQIATGQEIWLRNPETGTRERVHLL